MKVIIIFVIVLLQTYIIMPTNKTEEQKSSLVRQYKDFEIRFYPLSPKAWWQGRSDGKLKCQIKTAWSCKRTMNAQT